ncbi:MAG: SIMPL domain-containing protein [Alistipes sp.]|nr:SIMPL domain-containing protein [Alistipes sp.]
MKRLFVLLFVAFFAVPAMAQTYEIKTPYVSVNGYAEQEILPDEVYVQITLTESDSKGKITLEQQRRQMFSALKKCKIDVEKQLSMLDMASTYFKRRTSLASARYELKVGSAMEAQQVFEALDAVGISNVDITKVACSKEEEYRAAVRKAAMQDARQKASELAEAVGQSVGDCLVINDYSSRSGGVVFTKAVRGLAANAEMDAVAEEEPTVEFEKIKISYNVSAQFYLNGRSAE